MPQLGRFHLAYITAHFSLGDTWLGGKTVRMVLFRGGPGDDQRYAHATLATSAGGSPWIRFDIDVRAGQRVGRSNPAPVSRPAMRFKGDRDCAGSCCG